MKRIRSWVAALIAVGFSAAIDSKNPSVTKGAWGNIQSVQVVNLETVKFTVLGFNLLGDGLREILDRKQR